MNSTCRASRIVGIAAVTCAVGWALWWACRPGVADVSTWARGSGTDRHAWTLDRIVVDLAACGVVVLYLALVASAAVTLVGGSIGPLWWRRIVLTACGIGLVAPALTSPALAADDVGAPVSPAHCPSACASAEVELSGLPLPELPEERARSQPVAVVTVREGDSLWLIASRALGPAASDVEVARATQALYTENRIAIGPDPDLIIPGTELTRPGGT